MARPANLSDRDDEGSQFQRPTRASRQRSERAEVDSLPPSPGESFSSDKENRVSAGGSIIQQKKPKSMAPPENSPVEPGLSRPNRKRKLADREAAPTPTQMAHQHKLDDVGDRELYDPDQSIDERRAVRKDYRDLSRELTDSRGEYLASGSNGLINTLNRSNELFTSVRQTSDATLDSRLLVSTAGLSAKRTEQLILGDNAIDVDDFVGRCILYMRRADGEGDASTQRRRHARNDSDEEPELGEGFDEGDVFNWEWLGRQACFPNNVRPPVPGFLLGPLSVQKKARKITQRRERLKRDPKDAIRPDELKAKDLEQAENSNLTTLCTRIRGLLAKTQSKGQDLVEQEAEENDMSDEELFALMARHGLADDLGVPFFNFVVNPKSFGQTVENLFYVSFLIRDGAAGLGSDHNMMPTLHVTDPSEPQAEDKKIKDQAVQKHQAIFHLDFETWEDLIETFEIKESIIPHRQADPAAQVSATGWYA